MLKSLSVNNYKSYRDTTFVEFSPLTVFCGANSSGKSALIKCILMLKQSFEATGDNCLLLNGAYTNNGLYEDICYFEEGKKRNTKIELSVTFEIKKGTTSFKDI